MSDNHAWLDAIEASPSVEDWVPYVNEVATGGRAKLALDKPTGRLRYKRTLPDEVRFPTNYGFIPRTLNKQDDMELDLLVVSTEPLPPLAIANVRVVGGCAIVTDDRPEDKIIGVLLDDPAYAAVRELGDLGVELRRDISLFFELYKRGEATVRFERWYERADAIAKIEATS